MLKPIYKALIYSLSGLKVCMLKERAFKQECILFLISLFFMVVLPINFQFCLTLLTVGLFVLILELLNSALERAVDLASPGFSQTAKEAKDIASAAVFLGLLVWLIFWVKAIYSLF